MSKNGYVIQVGHYAPQKVIVSVPTKDGNPSPDAIEAFGGVGVHQIINRARVWGRRVLDNGKLPVDEKGEEITCEVTTKNYHGKLEFLEWGKAVLGAQAIEIRYLTQSQSLDVAYQDNIQKIILDPEGKDGSAFIDLASGQNKYDYNKEALFITYLSVHPQNKDSKSKNPDPKIKGYMFHEVTDELADSTFIKQAESQIVAGAFVKELSVKPSSLKNLMSLFIDSGIDFGQVNLLSGDLDMYKALLQFAGERPSDFGLYIQNYKKEISDCFEKAKSYNALDLTKNGFIAMLIENKKDIVFEGIEGKGDDMLVSVLDNFLDSEIYEKSKRLKDLCKKLN
jgi:hypothetical protein